ncbi:hypothetical protein JD422_16215 [Leclercia adecarboxylata]|uniref:hypothetical protein n=1 Tax=Acinetobacter sp. UBA5984 TaxID=1945948 RepID=UPI0019045CA1|nr:MULTISPECIES: hypothetical protein [Gammaproteobacteria]MBK0352179.1 hypothetical protein [Leclercia adecarboxylata]
MKIAYITKSSLKKIIYQSSSAAVYSIDALINTLGENINVANIDNIRELFSDPEIRFLFYTAKFSEFIEKNKLQPSTNYRQFNDTYLFNANSKPKFHTNRNCEYLKSNFKNFLIPPEIKDRGESEVIKAQKFAFENRHLAQSDEQRFITKLSAQFMLINPPSKIDFDNSGIQEFSALSLDEMVISISKKISSCIDFLNKNKESIKNGMYKAKSKCKSDDPPELIEWLTIIKPALIESIFEYNCKKNNLSEKSFEVAFLEKFGFEECKSCSQ